MFIFIVNLAIMTKDLINKFEAKYGQKIDKLLLQMAPF